LTKISLHVRVVVFFWNGVLLHALYRDIECSVVVALFFCVASHGLPVALSFAHLVFYLDDGQFGVWTLKVC